MRRVRRSVSAELLRQSAILARQYHVRLHTHLCETKDEEAYMLEREGMRPLAFMQTLGWVDQLRFTGRKRS